MRKEFLQVDSDAIRQRYLKKGLRGDNKRERNRRKKPKAPSGNVAIVVLFLANDRVFAVGATSRGWSGKDECIPKSTSQRKSPIFKKPLPKSQGGQFEPIIDSYSGRIMDTDAEYKILSAAADALDLLPNTEQRGKLYLYTERESCESCQSVLEQFKAKYPQVEVADPYWDYPYP